MKVGDYIRTSSGKIAKYLGHEGDKYKFDDYIYWYYEYYNDYVYDEDYEEWLEEEEVKVYKNLINLIEVGDYVNGHRVNFIDGDREYFVISFGDDAYTLKSQFNGDIYWVSKDDIKSIVTKESMESVTYYVK